MTSSIAQHLRDYGVRPERISVMPNAVADPGPPPPGPGDGFLFAGRLAPEKGLSLLLEAWERHPVGSLGPLRIAGDGPERGLAEAAATRRADVRYLGPRTSGQVAEAIREAACVVAPPTWHDVLPTIALEALANGRPVLATAMGGLPDIVGAADPDDPAGWVVEPTVDAVASGLTAAHTGTAERVAGLAARRRYERRFTPALITERLIDIYSEVAGMAGTARQ